MINYLIHLDRRTDRLIDAETEFAKMGMEFSLVLAFDEKPGWVGCKKSHLYILRELPGTVFAVYEDDVQFLLGERDIRIAMDELPEDWDMLYLGASPQEPFYRYSPHLFKMGKSWTTHAIIWHRREGGAINYILQHEDEIGKIDVFLSEQVHPKFNCFLVSPLICTQKQTQSDCCKRSDLSTIVRNYNRYCK
jgi:hypothetical protein